MDVLLYLSIVFNLCFIILLARLLRSRYELKKNLEFYQALQASKQGIVDLHSFGAAHGADYGTTLNHEPYNNTRH